MPARCVLRQLQRRIGGCVSCQDVLVFVLRFEQVAWRCGWILLAVPLRSYTLIARALRGVVPSRTMLISCIGGISRGRLRRDIRSEAVLTIQARRSRRPDRHPDRFHRRIQAAAWDMCAWCLPRRSLPGLCRWEMIITMVRIFPWSGATKAEAEWWVERLSRWARLRGLPDAAARSVVSAVLRGSIQDDLYATASQIANPTAESNE